MTPERPSFLIYNMKVKLTFMTKLSKTIDIACGLFQRSITTLLLIIPQIIDQQTTWKWSGA